MASNLYKIGDKVKLNKYHYLHGIGSNYEVSKFIANNGVISKEATGDFSNHAFQFVVGLWKVNDDISLQEYIENYSGIIANVNNQFWQVPYKRIDEFVKKMIMWYPAIIYKNIFKRIKNKLFKKKKKKLL